MYSGIGENYPLRDENTFIEAMLEHYTSEEDQKWGAVEIGISLIY